MRYKSGVVLTEAFQRYKIKVLYWFIWVNIFWIAVVGFLFFEIKTEEKILQNSKYQMNILRDFQIKEEIYALLRVKGISLAQGIDIAEVVVNQSKELDLPIGLILAVMKKESNFESSAISPKKAMGIMQIHPITWNEYIDRMKLEMSYHAAFDPIVNIKVATNILKDLYNFYRTQVKKEEEVWKYALSAYYAGSTSLSKTGIQRNHINYVESVKRIAKDYESR